MRLLGSDRWRVRKVDIGSQLFEQSIAVVGDSGLKLLRFLILAEGLAVLQLRWRHIYFDMLGRWFVFGMVCAVQHFFAASTPPVAVGWRL